jgi:hypothetical protein
MKLLLLLLAYLLALPCAAKETVKLCFDNEDAYPSTLKNGTGLSFYLLNIVAKQLDVQMIYTPLPWKRCLKEVQAGYMAASVLKQRQVPTEDSSQSTDDIFRKLSMGLIQIAVVEERQGDRSLKTHPEYANKIEKLAPPFLISDLFLAFSYPFENKKTKLSQAIWKEITHVRESKQYKNPTQE